MSLSLDALAAAVAALDDEKHSYRGLSYDLTSANAFATPPAPWWDFIPYASWSDAPSSKVEKLPNPSPFEQAILDVVPDPKDAPSQVFVDLSHLGVAYGGFFDDDSAQAAERVVERIGALLDAGKHVTIRYLYGNRSSHQPKDDGLVQALFSSAFKSSHRNLANGSIYFGNFAPDFALRAATADARVVDMFSGIERLLRELLKDIEKVSADLAARLAALEKYVAGWIARFLETTVPVFSWNHAKIAAVDGVALTTGGANYWHEYTTGQDGVFDMALTLQGDAAASAHRFQNYLWAYLASSHPTDDSSLCLFANLADPISAFSKPTSVPMYDGGEHDLGKTAALCVGRNGLWPSFDPALSIQLFDAVRDFVANVVSAIAETHVDAKTDTATAFVVERFGDDNPAVRAFLNSLGVSPAAWATRYARNHAIANAQTSLRFTQQKFVMDDLVNSSASGFRALVDEINQVADIRWDGYFWPLDTLSALSYALANFDADHAAKPALQIVCSYYQPDVEGYQDPVTAEEFATRLTGVMRGLQALGRIDSTLDAAKIVADHLRYKRISATTSGEANHSKVAIVDDTLIYVGSDNAYPSYNIEFGVWTGDSALTKAFVDGYWTALWSYAVDAVLEPA